MAPVLDKKYETRAVDQPAHVAQRSIPCTTVDRPSASSALATSSNHV